MQKRRWKTQVCMSHVQSSALFSTFRVNRISQPNFSMYSRIPGFKSRSGLSLFRTRNLMVASENVGLFQNITTV